jgi:hypothetical protein
MTSTLRELFDSLQEDQSRKGNPFSQDISQAHEVLHHPYASDQDIRHVMNQWSIKRQPCQFGRIGGKFHFIHICILRDRDLLEGDKAVREKIARERKLWKQRAILNTVSPPHSFMLLVCSRRVSLAAPDTNLRLFAEKIRDLAGWQPSRRQLNVAGEVSSDALYLQNPADQLYYGFQFNVDFFATAGDGRWWHDHRIPGGAGFTANSTGHMKAWQEWYSEPGKDRGDWFLTQAMYTISQSYPTRSVGSEPERPTAASPIEEGRITWLRDLQNGRPMKQSACPFRGSIPGFATNKDWTTYEGLIHTDHAVRPEFFNSQSGPPTVDRPYFNDFTYLYETRSEDHLKFVRGVARTQESIYAELGPPESWTVRGDDDLAEPRSPQVELEIRSKLAICDQWPDLATLQKPSSEL